MAKNKYFDEMTGDKKNGTQESAVIAKWLSSVERPMVNFDVKKIIIKKWVDLFLISKIFSSEMSKNPKKKQSASILVKLFMLCC